MLLSGLLPHREGAGLQRSLKGTVTMELDTASGGTVQIDTAAAVLHAGVLPQQGGGQLLFSAPVPLRLLQHQGGGFGHGILLHLNPLLLKEQDGILPGLLLRLTLLKVLIQNDRQQGSICAKQDQQDDILHLGPFHGSASYPAARGPLGGDGLSPLIKVEQLQLLPPAIQLF